MTTPANNRPSGHSRSSPPHSPADAALRAGSFKGETRLQPLIDAVPAMLAEAQRRRRAAAAPAARVSGAARVWLPRLAMVTALLVFAALVWPRGSNRTGPAESRDAIVTESASLENWLVTGRASTSLSDPVLDALVR